MGELEPGSDVRVPAADLVGGVLVPSLPEGCVVEALLGFGQFVDPEGEQVSLFRGAGDYRNTEIWGVLSALVGYFAKRAPARGFERVGEGAVAGIEGDQTGPLVDAGELVQGFTVQAWEQLASRESTFMVLKVRYRDGSRGWVIRKPLGANLQEILGLLVIQVEILRKKLLDEWE